MRKGSDAALCAETKRDLAGVYSNPYYFSFWKLVYFTFHFGN